MASVWNRYGGCGHTYSNFILVSILVLFFVLQLLSGTSPSRSMNTPTSSLSHPIPTTPSSSRSSNWVGRKRGRPFDSDDASKRRRVSNSYPAKPGTVGEKSHQGKGLRHFSQRVCEKVRQKGNTTYNEVRKSKFCNN